MTWNTIFTCVGMPFAVVLVGMILALIVIYTSPVLPELETLETFNWVHSQ